MGMRPRYPDIPGAIEHGITRWVMGIFQMKFPKSDTFCYIWIISGEISCTSPLVISTYTYVHIKKNSAVYECDLSRILFAYILHLQYYLLVTEIVESGFSFMRKLSVV